MEMREKHEVFEQKTEDYLYKIGMFAAMNHMTVKALRFYEERGLLMPAFINQENGYRYYTLSQMAILHKITALKMAGFTIDEIALMNSGADEEIVLYKKKSDILSKIAELTKQVAVIDGYLAKKKGSLSVPVLVKMLPETTVAYIEDRIESYDNLFEVMPRLGALMERVGCECALPEYCFTNYLESEYKSEDILVEICESVVKPKTEMDGIKFKKIDETQAACAFHKGSYNNFHETYEIVFKYIEENDYVIAGPIRESYIDGIWNKDDESEWLTEIQVPVKKK